jgi:hypothetical protein
MRFEWDERKNRANQRKHGVSLEHAARVFDDPLALSRIDPRHDDVRWITLGLVDDRILLVAHTYHDSESDDDEEIIRIISARQATAAEGRAYQGEASSRH